MSSDRDLKERFNQALAAIAAKAQQDPYLLAVIVFGSMSHDKVWEKSDLDLMLICLDEKGAFGANRGTDRAYALTECGINIHASLQSRSGFKKMIEGSLQSSIMHSAFSKSRLVWTRDPTIAELYEGVQKLGARDRAANLLRAGAGVVGTLYKAQKWFHVHGDLEYSYLWIVYCLTPLAQIEVYLDSQIAGREVIQQAMILNPKFFRPLYVGLANRKKTAKDIANALAAIDGYLFAKRRTLFGPILDYLHESQGPRSATEIETHFKNNMYVELAAFVCEWLADKEVVSKLSSPVRLTTRSRVAFEELAYYYSRDER